MTREEIMTIIQDCAAQMGRAPNLVELKKATNISLREIRKNFGFYRRALEVCGLVRRGAGYQVSDKTLFLEWATIVRKLGKIPSAAEWDMAAQFSLTPLRRRYGSMNSVPQGMLFMPEKTDWRRNGTM